ncbi:hypothetical protein AusDCA_3892 [Desulfitobacterium sp. AusDCA]
MSHGAILPNNEQCSIYLKAIGCHYISQSLFYGIFKNLSWLL